jgi:hypothetical protein
MTFNELDTRVNRNFASSIIGETGRSEPRQKPASQPNPSLDSSTTSAESALVGSLLDRIRSLESKAASEEVRSTDINLTIREDTGQFLKSKYYGQSHWMNAIDPVRIAHLVKRPASCYGTDNVQYEALGQKNIIVNQNTNRTEVNKKTELYAAVARIKQMSRIIKTSRLSQPSISQEIHDSVPPKEVCDVLVGCYFRTSEGIFRVLHVPSFRKEYEAYWKGDVLEKPSVILKVLLVCAMGVPFYDGPDWPLLRVACTKWIQAAMKWLSGPHVKSRLNMTGLQIEILTLLARQLCNVDGDHIWITAGSLLRAAMHLGLHRDPAHFGKISLYHQEMRRRLWATVLEITAQGSLDMGMPPMISSNDYDTKAPSSINDEDIKEGLDTPLNVRLPTDYTDCSIQIASTETLPIRFEVIRLINSLRFDLAYDVALNISGELNDACRNHFMFFKSALNGEHSITPFQIKMADSLIRRFILCLHRPYFSRAKENPQYHFSRKMCLDTSLAFWAPATELIPGQEDDWTRMSHRCVGFFKSFFLYAISTIYIELNTQIDEQKHASAIFAPLIFASTSPSNHAFPLPAQFQTLRQILVSAHETTIALIRNGITNVKGAVFMSCALARIDAIVSGADAEPAVLEAAKSSVKETSRILMEVYQAEHGVPIDLSIPTAGKDQNRGEGADDVTGHRLQTGTDAGIEVPSSEVDAGDVDAGLEGGVLDGSMNVDGLDMFDDGLCDLDGHLNLDACMDPSIYTNHFARSPEWFYDMNGYIMPESWSNAFGM